MKTFILFLYTTFKNFEDVEFFCIEVLGFNPAVNKVRYVIEDDPRNVIVIFESDVQRKPLAEAMRDILLTDMVKYYFLFDRESIHSANLPLEVKDFIFNPPTESASLKIEYTGPGIEQMIPKQNKKERTPEVMTLDNVLDKIKQHGVSSLTPEEKKFLDELDE